MSEDTCYNCEASPCIFYWDFENNVAYYMCRDCGKLWREVAGVVPDMDVIADDVEILEHLPLAVFEAYTETVMKPEMQDFVHRCLYCQSLAFETELGFYSCSNEECGFEWEVYSD